MLTNKVFRATLEKAQDSTLAGEEVRVSTMRTFRRIIINVPIISTSFALAHRIHFIHLFKLYPFYI
jgi:hypothetical protein